MERRASALRLEDRLRAAGEVHAARLHPETRRFAPAALAAAVALHALAGLLSFPRASGADPPPSPLRGAVAAGPLHAVVPLPVPRIPASSAGVSPEAPRPAAAEAAAQIAAPEPPELPIEPWIETVKESDLAALPPEAGLPLGVPEPPPAGPAYQEPGIITNPVLIPGSRVQPVYPARAKRLGLPGNVLLDVSVLPDGSVGEIAVLRCTPPDQGFCEAAVRAARRWRYLPGLRDGRPTQVSLKVNVDFKP